MIRFPRPQGVIFKTMAVYYDESLNHDRTETRKSKTAGRRLGIFDKKPAWSESPDSP